MYCQLLHRSKLSFRQLVSDLTDELNYQIQVQNVLAGPLFARFAGLLRTRPALGAQDAFDAMPYSDAYALLRDWEGILKDEQQWTSTVKQTGIGRMSWIYSHLTSYSEPYLPRIAALLMKLWNRDRFSR